MQPAASGLDEAFPKFAMPGRGRFSYVADVVLLVFNIARFTSTVLFLALLWSLAEFSGTGKALILLLVLAHVADRGFCIVKGMPYLRNPTPLNKTLFTLFVIVGGTRAMLLILYPYGFKEEMLRRSVSVITVVSTIVKVVLLFFAFLEALNFCGDHPSSSPCAASRSSGSTTTTNEPLSTSIGRQAIITLVLAYVSGVLLFVDLVIDFCCCRYSRLKKDYEEQQSQVQVHDEDLSESFEPSRSSATVTMEPAAASKPAL
ncbi:hypothetical protein BC831DRAFT_471164 [Entophlyctis helioformis]|nr:hypothetical protein BC831DRAFT_471164 [Entophlyctis helioformis]